MDLGTNSRGNIIRLFYIAVALAIALMIPAAAYTAGPFTAKTVGDYGNVTVMEVTGNYDANDPDGALNSAPRQTIAKEFYRLHKDEYDFLIIFTNFSYQMPDADAKAFYTHVKNDVQGIGQDIYDNSALFGSNGKLQGTVDMGNISDLSAIPFEPGFDDSLSILGHELLHRWAAFVRFKDSTGALSTALLGKDLKHWSYLLDSRGSVLYGNLWQDNGNGTFQSTGALKSYSPLDQYLMGLIDKSQVPPMLLIDNPDIDPATASMVGATVSGSARYVTIEDIIAAEGERVPGAADSQKSFKTAFIFVTAPGTFTGDELYGLENIRNGWMTRHSVLTDGAGIVEVALSPIEDLPINPGVIPPAVTPRTDLPNIDDGVKWLMGIQTADGSWIDITETAARDTAEVVLALKSFDIAAQNYLSGLGWLSGSLTENVDFLSRKMDTLKDTGQDTSAIVIDLISKQNDDGGWGSDQGYDSNPADTSRVLKVLGRAGCSNQPVISKAIEFLKSRQNTDNGWGSDDEESKVEATANVLSAFNKYRGTYQLDDRIASGGTWLTQKQNPDGGFGNSPSTIYDTATAVLTLAELDISRDARSSAINYIFTQQSADGSWRDFEGLEGNCWDLLMG